MVQQIERILSERGARFSVTRPSGNPEHAQGRRDIVMLLADNFDVFDEIRVPLSEEEGVCPENTRQRALLKTLLSSGYVERAGGGSYRFTTTNNAYRKFITGGWLEELAYCAVQEAGAHAAVFGQWLDWEIEGYSGINEVDVIARHGERLVFVSCKCAQAVLQSKDTSKGCSQRTNLRRNLDEADNWVDQFGDPNRDSVIFLVTTDLIDEERNNAARYPALFGKAKALDVHLVSLDHMRWDTLVNRFQDVILGEFNGVRLD